MSMNDWHRKVAAELVSETPAGFGPDGAAALEIGLGHVRSAIAYVLELARAHRLDAAGNVTGDDVWLELGEARVRATLNRRQAQVAWAVSGQDTARLRWDDAMRAIVDDGGARRDMGALARDAIDAMVSAWRSGSRRSSGSGSSSAAPHSSAPPPEFEDEPTKG
jgi:hypothetical protein